LAWLSFAVQALFKRLFISGIVILLTAEAGSQFFILSDGRIMRLAKLFVKAYEIVIRNKA
jgi:hypothetical protein